MNLQIKRWTNCQSRCDTLLVYRKEHSSLKEHRRQRRSERGSFKVCQSGERGSLLGLASIRSNSTQDNISADENRKEEERRRERISVEKAQGQS